MRADSRAESQYSERQRERGEARRICVQHVNYYSSVKNFILLLSMIPDSIHSFVGVKVYTQIPLTFCYIPHIRYCLQYASRITYIQTNELWGEVGGVVGLQRALRAAGKAG